ncbi:HNH endonuclease signature motif containing protein [Mesobacterium sp. TK19101]|uniref:Putative HNH nuclease YajD n=1 Tax=Mesobacterium hydrothermale TaxID=3111907 RepID=A0ABU6HLH5_9RHOB|nr:HNH endonuclease signature motif containing protein [Mesobacterium sp. TK19101]MEC3863308.1 HNH endonuclease signature motif containing protein [Mesobacterium sp. TK19101]
MSSRFHRHSKPILRTKRWKVLRMEILERDGFACVKCGARGRLEVDHIRPVRDCPEKAFDPANLQSLCPSCHTAKTRLECGHKPPDPKRQAWSKLVEDLSKPSKTGVYHA